MLHYPRMLVRTYLGAVVYIVYTMHKYVGTYIIIILDMNCTYVPRIQIP